MKPSIAVDITARDKTEAGRKSAERGFGQFAKKTGAAAKDGGFARLGKQLEGFGKLKGLSFSFDNAGRSLASIGRTSGEVASGFREATTNALGFGQAGTGAMGAVAEVAGTAAGAVAGVATVVVGLAAATYALGDKWAKTGAEVDRTSRGFGVNAAFVQRARAANERFGVSTEQTTASLEGLSSTLYDAEAGSNNLALGALTQLGVHLKKNKDGVVDLESAYYDLADAIARQKNPATQRKLAAVFGMSGALPAIRQGSGQLKADAADFAGSGAELTPDEVARAARLNRKTVTVRQHLGALEKGLGVGAMTATEGGIDAVMAQNNSHQSLGDRALSAIQGPLAAVTAEVKGWVHSGKAAGDHLVDGARKAGGELVDGIEAFVRRIEHRESGGHQQEFRKGHAAGPLTSDAGAIGAMQLLPATAKRAAAFAGLPWDPQRFRTDKGYNEALGRAELQRLLQKFGGDQVLAAAAYNAGEGVLTGPYRDRQGRLHQGWLKRFGDPRTGQVSDADFAKAIPFKETRDYVAQTAHVKVDVQLRGAPAGTVAAVTGAPGVDVGMHIARSLEGP